MRWLILLYANVACLVGVLGISRGELVLRTYATVIPACIGIAGYLYLKYRKQFSLKSDLLTSLGVMTQFLLAPLYLVSVPLTGAVAFTMWGYQEYFPEVALATLIGQTLFFVAYERGMTRTKDKPIETAEENLSGTPFRFLYMMLPVICAVWVSRVILLQTESYYHLLPSQFMFDSPYYSILAQLSGFGIFVIAGLWVMFFNSPKPNQGSGWLIFAIVITLLEFLWYFPTGSREPVLALGVVIFFAYVFINKRIPIKWVAVGIVSGLLLLSSMDYYRYAIIKYVGPSTIQATTVMQALGESKTNFLESDYRTGNWLTTAMARLADARSISAILQGVPSTVPYLGGESYLRIPWVFIPRFIYPEKPEMIMPMSFGLLPNEGGSSPTTLIGEAYLNFGWLGLFLIMPIMGWISCRYDAAFQRRITNPAWVAVYVGMATQIVRMPVQPVAIWFGLFLKTYLLALLLAKWDKIFSMEILKRNV